MWKGSHGAKGKNACLRSHAQARMHSGVAALSCGDPVGPREPNLAFAKSHLGCVKPQKRDRVVGGRFLAVHGECGREK